MNILITHYFKKQIKSHLKKHKNLLNDTINLLTKFDKNTAVHIGHHVYKIRLKSSNLKRGKRNSFRLIILLIEVDNLITPITLYFKGDKENISKKEITLHEKIIIHEINEGLSRKTNNP